MDAMFAEVIEGKPFGLTPNGGGTRLPPDSDPVTRHGYGLRLLANPSGRLHA